MNARDKIFAAKPLRKSLANVILKISQPSCPRQLAVTTRRGNAKVAAVIAGAISNRTTR